MTNRELYNISDEDIANYAIVYDINKKDIAYCVNTVCDNCLFCNDSRFMGKGSCKDKLLDWLNRDFNEKMEVKKW